MKTVLKISAVAVLAAGGLYALAPARAQEGQVGNPACGKQPGHVGHGTKLTPLPGNQLAAFAQGCFWGSEERFRKVKGVVATAVGYTGGHAENPSYLQVCGDGTGHAEAVLVEFDPKQVTYEQLLKFFWQTHDPTSGDRQGPDSGSQYRSAIFTFDAGQLKAARLSRDEAQKALADKITTEIAPAGPFWLAEGYHQQYDEVHGSLSCPLPHRGHAKE